MNQERKSRITDEERRFINREGGSLYVNALLVYMRDEELTLEEAYQNVISDPNQQEQIPGFTDARTFLLKHAEVLRIETDVEAST
jgi:hypothetical protein